MDTKNSPELAKYKDQKKPPNRPNLGLNIELQNNSVELPQDQSQ